MKQLPLQFQLDSERAPKVRAGLYIEEALLDQVRSLADHNNISVNESLVLLIKRGIAASQQK